MKARWSVTFAGRVVSFRRFDTVTDTNAYVNCLEDLLLLLHSPIQAGCRIENYFRSRLTACRQPDVARVRIALSITPLPRAACHRPAGNPAEGVPDRNRSFRAALRLRSPVGFHHPGTSWTSARQGAEYYAAEGEKDPIVVELPKGSYLLTFHHRNLPAATELPRHQLSHGPRHQRIAVCDVDASWLLAAAALTIIFLLINRKTSRQQLRIETRPLSNFKSSGDIPHQSGRTLGGIQQRRIRRAS